MDNLKNILAVILLSACFNCLGQGVSPIQRINNYTAPLIGGGTQKLIIARDTTIRSIDSAYAFITTIGGRVYTFDTTFSKRWIIQGDTTTGFFQRMLPKGNTQQYLSGNQTLRNFQSDAYDALRPYFFPRDSTLDASRINNFTPNVRSSLSVIGAGSYNPYTGVIRIDSSVGGGGAPTINPLRLYGRYGNTTGAGQEIKLGNLFFSNDSLYSKVDTAATQSQAIAASRQTGFNTVAEMIVAGDKFRQANGLYQTFTLGFYAAGDGGAAIYRRNDTCTVTKDGAFHIAGGTGCWELQETGIVNMLQIGARANHNAGTGEVGLDNYPILIKAINHFPANQTPIIYFPAPLKGYIDPRQGYYYKFNTNPGNINRTVIIYGDGYQSQLLLNGAQLGLKTLGPNSIVRDLTIAGNTGNESTGYRSQTAHGIWVASNGTIVTRVFVRCFNGNGVFVGGDVNAGTNANHATVSYCHFKGNGDAGAMTKGGDANACDISNNYSEGNAIAGFWYEDFLGSTAVNNSTQANASYHPLNKTVVTYNGVVYNAIHDNINVTPGTNPSVWAPVQFSDFNNRPWSSTTQYYAGAGSVYVGSNSRTFHFNPYFEFDEYPLIQNSTIGIFGGFGANLGKCNGCFAYVQSWFQTQKLRVVNNSNGSYAGLDADGNWGGQIVVGDAAGQLDFQKIGNFYAWSTNRNGASANVRLLPYNSSGEVRVKMQHQGPMDFSGDDYSNTYFSVTVASSVPSNFIGSNGDIRINVGSDSTISLWKKIGNIWVAMQSGNGKANKTDLTNLATYSYVDSVTRKRGLRLTYLSEGGTFNIPDSVDILEIDVEDAVTNYTLVLPASTRNLKDLRIYGGGIKNPGETLITNLTISAAGGWTIYQSTTPTTLSGGNTFSYTSFKEQSRWRRTML